MEGQGVPFLESLKWLIRQNRYRSRKKNTQKKEKDQSEKNEKQKVHNKRKGPYLMHRPDHG
jgi:hypothetical protein